MRLYKEEHLVLNDLSNKIFKSNAKDDISQRFFKNLSIEKYR